MASARLFSVLSDSLNRSPYLRMHHRLHLIARAVPPFYAILYLFVPFSFFLPSCYNTINSWTCALSSKTAMGIDVSHFLHFEEIKEKIYVFFFCLFFKCVVLFVSRIESVTNYTFSSLSLAKRTTKTLYWMFLFVVRSCILINVSKKIERNVLTFFVFSCRC